MRPQTKLHPETIAIRQMLATGAISFAVGFVAVYAGMLWLQYVASPERFWSWELAFHVLHYLHVAFFGGLCLCAMCCSVVSRRHFRLGYHRCPYCNRVLEGIGTWCLCPEVQALKRQADAAKRPVAYKRWIGPPRLVGAEADIQGSSVMQPQRSATRRRAVVLFAVTLLSVGGGVVWIANAVRVARAETREYREEHSEAKILGKTADEIFAMYGNPYAAERGPDGKPVFIIYKQVKHGQYCAITLKDGVAIKVSFYFQ